MTQTNRTLKMAAIFAFANGIHAASGLVPAELGSRSGKLSSIFAAIAGSSEAFAGPCDTCHSKSEGNGSISGGAGGVSGSAGGAGKYSKQVLCSERLCEKLIDKGSGGKL